MEQEFCQTVSSQYSLCNLSFQHTWPHYHPEGGSSDLDICGRYPGFLTLVLQWESMRIFFFLFWIGGAVKDQVITGLWIDWAQT